MRHGLMMVLCNTCQEEIMYIGNVASYGGKGY